MLSLVLPLSAAQADEEKGGDVDIPAPREATPAPAPAPTPTPVQEPVAAAPPAWIQLESTSIAAGIGVSWGEGVLAYEGVDHTFSVRGLSLLDVGASVAEGLGEVYNLESLEHFEGTYVAVEATGAAGVGLSAARMRNEHGVEISLRSDLVGVELALAPQSFSIRFK
jgi:hypothetical protein